ncbi:MAG: TIGR00645 family protein [Gammaproteobacteria bacterium]|nr:TIGR00645 family protein [Gammaproteobacteria bacterium]MBQ0840343.1 TIGR00645 family protein [Gammaproteobacteria bacterium]
MKNMEHKFEQLMFVSRWLLVPLYVGLIASVLLLIYKFYGELAHLFLHVATLSESQIVVGLLTLIDLSLIANLLFIITFSGYESFVSKIDVSDHEDKPDWMGKVSFGALKIKVIGSIVAISAIELLKIFMDMDAYTETQIMWKVIIHLTFVASGVLFALMDRLAFQH